MCALIREARGNVDGANADRNRGFELRPIDGKGWDARGIARLNDDPQKARDDFEEGLRAYPESPALLKNLIHIYGDVLNQQELALAKADRLLELCPDEPSAWSTLAVLRRDLATATAPGKMRRMRRPIRSRHLHRCNWRAPMP